MLVSKPIKAKGENVVFKVVSDSQLKHIKNRLMTLGIDTYTILDDYIEYRDKDNNQYYISTEPFRLENKGSGKSDIFNNCVIGTLDLRGIDFRLSDKVEFMFCNLKVEHIIFPKYPYDRFKSISKLMEIFNFIEVEEIGEIISFINGIIMEDMNALGYLNLSGIKSRSTLELKDNIYSGISLFHIGADSVILQNLDTTRLKSLTLSYTNNTMLDGFKHSGEFGGISFYLSIGMGDDEGNILSIKDSIIRISSMSLLLDAGLDDGLGYISGDTKYIDELYIENTTIIINDLSSINIDLQYNLEIKRLVLKGVKFIYEKFCWGEDIKYDLHLNYNGCSFKCRQMEVIDTDRDTLIKILRSLNIEV